MTTITKACGLTMFLAVLILAALAHAQSATTQQSFLSVQWDFSLDNNLNHIKEPLSYSFDTGYLYGPGQITFDLERGLQGKVDFWFIQVWRDPANRDRAKGLAIYLSPERQDDAADSAISLAKVWGITNTAPIDQFRKTSRDSLKLNPRSMGTEEYGPDGKIAPKQSARVIVEIRDSGDSKKPFCVVLHVPLRDGSRQSDGIDTDPTRTPANTLFDTTGMFVNSAAAFPAEHFAAKMKMANVVWIALQIDNGGKVRDDNADAIEKGWADQWRAAGFKVGFWGCPRGVAEHGKQSAVDAAIPLVQADAELAVKLSAKYHADFYLADVEDFYQSYNPTDPTPEINRVYVEAYKKAATAAGIADMPKALSSEGRIALDMKPWIDAGWDAMPQAYWNAYAVYQPSKCVDFYMQTGWPIGRIHPTIGTFTGEGEKRTVSLAEYDKDLRSRPTSGFSFYLPESYLHDDSEYKLLAKMGTK